MLPSDRGPFAALLHLLVATLTPGRELSDEMLAGYWEALRDLELQDLQASALALLKRAEGMPKPFQLRAGAALALENRAGRRYYLPPPAPRPWTREQASEAREALRFLARQLGPERALQSCADRLLNGLGTDEAD